MSAWLQIVISGLSALLGGVVGGWLVAFKIGAWQQRVNDRLDAHEARLQRGNPAVDQVPVMAAKFEALIEDVREIKDNLRDWMPRLVTKEECNRRHGDGR